MERKLHFRENWLIFLGIWGEAELIVRIWGAKEKYFQGADVLSFSDLGRSMHYFQGSREHRPPWGASDLINVICGKNFCQGHWRNCSNFCIKYINVCQASIKLFLFC